MEADREHLDISRGPFTAKEYDRALEMWPNELMRLVKNVAIVPVWIGDTDTFWYRDEDNEGYTFKIVDASTGRQKAAFDHERLAKALNAKPSSLPFDRFEFVSGHTIRAVSLGRKLEINLRTGESKDVGTAVSAALNGPAGRSLFIREFNIWLRESDGTESPLTDDGVQFRAWGGPADNDLQSVARNRAEVSTPIAGCYWSPSGKTVLAQRLDQTRLPPYPYLESVPLDGSPRPKLHFIRHHLSGERIEAVPEWAIIDVKTRKRVTLTKLPGELRPFALNGGAWWSSDGGTIYLLGATDDTQHVALVAVDAGSGAWRILHDERCDTFFNFNTLDYNTPNTRLLESRREMIWYSQADGWGHLYAIDLVRGGVKRRLTKGSWAVFDILAVTDRHLFFSAGGKERGRNPYYRHLYRIDLDGDAPNSGLKLLTPDDADHGFAGEPTPMIARALGRSQGNSQMSPSGRYFLDCISRVDCAPVYVVRNTDGEKISEIARADISQLVSTGWSPPEMFCAKAADGVTDMYGVLVKPRAFKALRSWPVLEKIYGGPQIIVYPRSFLEGLNGSFTHGLNALAELGFVVALVDGPGTPYRSKTFHDMPYGTDDRWGIRHHRAALENAAKERSWMDLSCVGVSGHSYGGYGTAMALLLEPDFYKVGVSSAGMYDPMRSQRSASDRFMGRPIFEDGAFTKANPAEVAINYKRYSPSHLADRLKGQLLLAYGDLDENIQPAALLEFADKLIRAGKDFDLLYLPGRNHNYVPDPYFQKRLWDYFILHVLGRRPLLHHKLNVQPGTRLFI